MCDLGPCPALPCTALCCPAPQAADNILSADHPQPAQGAEELNSLGLMMSLLGAASVDSVAYTAVDSLVRAGECVLGWRWEGAPLTLGASCSSLTLRLMHALWIPCPPLHAQGTPVASTLPISGVPAPAPSPVPTPAKQPPVTTAQPAGASAAVPEKDSHLGAILG